MAGTAAKARQLEEQAQSLQQRGYYREAEAPLVSAIGMWRLLRGAASCEALNAEISLAASYRRRGDAERAIKTLERVSGELAAAPRQPLSDRLHRSALNNLSVAYLDADRVDAAKRALEQCIELVDRALAESRGDADLLTQRARALDNLANVLGVLGDHRSAEALARESLGIYLEVAGDAAFETSVARANVGAALMRLGRCDEAAPFIERALEQTRSIVGGTHPMVATALLLRAELARHRGDRAAALRDAADSVTMSMRCGLPDNHPEVVRAIDLLSTIT